MTDVATADRLPTIDYMPRRDAVMRVLFDIDPAEHRPKPLPGRALTDDECDNVVRVVRREHEIKLIRAAQAASVA